VAGSEVWENPRICSEPLRVSHMSLLPTMQEIISGSGHTGSVDWWAFGIFIYEMLYGKTPFRGRNRQRTFTNILLKDLTFPPQPQVRLASVPALIFLVRLCLEVMLIILLGVRT
jgi:serine/threonine protein kinase